MTNTPTTPSVSSNSASVSAGRRPVYNFAEKRVIITYSDDVLNTALSDAFKKYGATVISLNMIELINARHGSEDRNNSIEASIHEATQHVGGIDILINTFSITSAGPAVTISSAEWARASDLTLTEMFFINQSMGKSMLARGQGVIVNMVTEAAFMPTEGHVVRSIVEAGIVMMTQALGIEWAKRGVRVAGVAAGPLKEGPALAAVKVAQQRRSPMHRLGTLAEIVEGVLFVASDQATYIVGETLRIDGGWTAYQLF